ncbi:alpha/beta hydrolase [Sphingomonas alpina]|uniref:Proline iminopeptidase n=1 Tax=Sphingomonas alpina TaxID=653931 RepID=A0A7H0LP44_9SPHN|nr:alpha/beta hydrolase [Sphingomonas alpina]QNQ11447.1 alpha/beta hydrolase [Sphingomonas alpina]
MILLSGMALLTGIPNATAQSRPGAAALTSQPALLRLDDGGLVAIRQGWFRVPENRATKDSRQIELPFIQIPSASKDPARPVIFLLAGGPGSSWIDFFNGPQGREQVLFYRQFADVVLFDQRGAIHAAPALDCPAVERIPAATPLTDAVYIDAMRKVAMACKTGWEKAGVDLRAYETIANAADVDALRAALGYGRISLIAGSYGSHLAIALMRYHPQSIERAIIWGMEGPDDTYDIPDGILQSLKTQAAAAEADPKLRPYLPPGGLIAALRTVVARLRERPTTVEIEGGGTITLGALDLQRALTTQANRGGEWPAFVTALYRGDYRPLADIALRQRDIRLSRSVLFAMDCASGLSEVGQRLIRDSPATPLLGDINLPYFATCDIWDSPDLGPSFRALLQTDIPILLFHGDWDVSTPLANSQAAIRGFSKGKFAVVHGGTHGVWEELFQYWMPLRSTVRDFMLGDDPDLPAEIALPAIDYRIPEE